MLDIRNKIKLCTEFSNNSTVLEILITNKIITNEKVQINENSICGTVLWARSKPKEIFNFMIQINKLISNQKFKIFIDDICPKILYTRTEKEQNEINNLYHEFFHLSDCDIFFSSQIFKEDEFIKTFFEYLNRLNIKQYISFLPETKKISYETLNMSEFVHTYLELFLFDYAKSIGVNTFIIGKFSQNIAFLQKQLYPHDESKYLIIPRI